MLISRRLKCIDTASGIVWVASGLLVGVLLQPADRTPPIQSDKYKCRIDTVISPDDGPDQHGH